MKALILNSGIGSRMGGLTHSHPKCMTELCTGQTILSRQIEQLEQEGIRGIVVTTGYYADELEMCAQSAVKKSRLEFVNNPDYASTNYIYSIFLAKELLRDDILLLHGDLVFSDSVLSDIINCGYSAVAVSSVVPLPEKDFKAVVEYNRVAAVGVEYFANAIAAQPLYRLLKKDWLVWLDEIETLIARGEKSCYAENAFNMISNRCIIYPYDVKNRLCMEIDTQEDLKSVNARLADEAKEGVNY